MISFNDFCFFLFLSFAEHICKDEDDDVKIEDGVDNSDNGDDDGKMEDGVDNGDNSDDEIDDDDGNGEIGLVNTVLSM